MQVIVSNDNAPKFPHTDAHKKASHTYYEKHKEEVKNRHKESYERIKDTDEYKQRKKLYNQNYVEKQRATIPQRPAGRPRKYILQTIELDPLETDISDSSASDTSESTLSKILKQFPVLENDIDLR